MTGVVELEDRKEANFKIKVNEDVGWHGASTHATKKSASTSAPDVLSRATKLLTSGGDARSTVRWVVPLKWLGFDVNIAADAGSMSTVIQALNPPPGPCAV